MIRRMITCMMYLWKLLLEKYIVQERFYINIYYVNMPLSEGNKVYYLHGKTLELRQDNTKEIKYYSFASGTVFFYIYLNVGVGNIG